MSERAFAFIRTNEREGKPRTRGLTEIRGPYYTPTGNGASPRRPRRSGAA